MLENLSPNDENNRIYVAYSSVTETYNTTTQSYRHLWARASWDDGYWGQFVDLTSNLIHVFHECVFPSVAPYSDDAWYLIYQTDAEPGLAVRGDEDPYGENFINYMKIFKDDVLPGIKEDNQFIFDYDVSQNYPNPFKETSVVNVNIRKSCMLSMEVTNLTGQKIFEISEREVLPGMNKIEIDASNMTPGIYFYTVKAGENLITKKMIVE